MSEYTKLKGVLNSQRSSTTNLLLDNFLSFYDWGFLDAGGYYNIDISNTRKSRLRPVNLPIYTDGTVWQTGRKNWVWETGISVGAPINRTHPHINGSEQPTGYVADYVNGRIHFSSPLPSGSVVTMGYSYKWLEVVPAHDVPFFREIQNFSNEVDSPQFINDEFGSWAQFGETRVQLPALAIEVVPPNSFKPYALGGGQWGHHTIVFYIITENRWECSNIMDSILFQNDRVIYLYDTNLIAQNNAFPLDSKNTPKQNALMYPQLVDDFRYKDCYIFNSRAGNIARFNNNLHIGNVSCSAEVFCV